MASASKAAKSFEDLHIFQASRELVAKIWKITRRRPFVDDRVLTYQIRRAGLSVASNIAEGFERASRPEFGRFLKIAKGSCGEVRAQLLVALDQEYLTKEEHDHLRGAAQQVSAGISNLARYLSEADRKQKQQKSK
jgi:four helix bundle protein